METPTPSQKRHRVLILGTGQEARGSQFVSGNVAIFLLFLGTGILVLVLCPPIWRITMALIQISTRPSDMTILRTRCAYPLFSRVHVYAVTIVQGWIHHHKAKHRHRERGGLERRRHPRADDFAGGGAGPRADRFVLSFTRSASARIWVTLLLISNASIFVTANLISTEALAEVLIIALVRWASGYSR